LPWSEGLPPERSRGTKEELSLPAENGLFLREYVESVLSFDLSVFLSNEGFPVERPRFGEEESRKADFPVPAERPLPALPLPDDGRLFSLLRIKCFLNRQRYTIVERQFSKNQSVKAFSKNRNIEERKHPYIILQDSRTYPS
jgi:hypothetical protein